MCPTYVLTACNSNVDFNHARCLMDPDLLQASIAAMKHEKTTAPRWECDYGAQWVWDYYCGRHADKYGKSFRPNVDPTWDT
jgi:hypothetical protein